MKKIVLIFLPLVAMLATTVPAVDVAPTNDVHLPILAAPEIVDLVYDEADPSGGWGLSINKTGHAYAVLFTPPSHPFDLTEVLYAAIVWTGYEENAMDPFDVVIYDKGTDNKPGAELGRLEDQVPDAEEPWSVYDVTSLGITIESGDFFFSIECLQDYAPDPGYPACALDFAAPAHGRSWLYTEFVDGEGNPFEDWLSFNEFGLSGVPGWPEGMMAGDSLDLMMRARGDATTIGIVEFGPGGIISVSSKLIASEGTIDYTLPEASDIVITVWDAAGRHVETIYSGHAEAGPHSLVWDGDAGIYFVHLRTAFDVKVARLVVVH